MSGLFKKRLPSIIFLIFFFSIDTLFALSAFSALSVKGTHKFCIGDNLRWADPEFDDSSWQSIKIPGSWRSQNIKPLRAIAWYRIRFRLPEGFYTKDPGIYLGVMSDADEVYLNGVRLGGEGRIGEHFVLAPYVPRVYRIPEGVLREKGANVMAIRVMNLYFDGGITEPVIGEYRNLALKALQRRHVAEMIEISILTVLGIFMLGLTFLYLKGARDKDIAYFFFVILIYAGYFFIDSYIFYKTGFKNHSIQKLSISLACVWFICFFLFLLHYFEQPFLRIYKILASLILLISIMILVALSWSTYPLFLRIWMLFVVPVSLAGTIYVLIRAYRLRKRQFSPIMVGILCLIIGGIIGEACLDLNIGPYNLSYLQPWDYGMFFFLMSVMYAIIARFVYVRNRMRLFASKILMAQEEERKRLARDLHDGLGQDLLVIKFNLQNLNKKEKNWQLESIIQDIDRSIKGLREISAGLSPALLAEMGLTSAITNFSKDISQKTGLRLQLDMPFKGRLPGYVEQNLFRIFQEALNNIIKHSGADLVKISMKRDSSHVIMSIEDNGKGFDINDNHKNRGLGLSLMAERVNIMQGRFHISSKRNKGTTIIVEVPINEEDNDSG